MTKRFGVPQARQDRSNALTAFTLAEVLITLGIIGVVAAMTIPTLISNTNGAQFKTAYKKALSTLNQAVLMNVAMEDTDFSTIEEDTAADGTKGIGALLHDRMQSATEISASYDAEGINPPTLTENRTGGAGAPTLSYKLACTGENADQAPQPGSGEDNVTINGQCQNGEVDVTKTMDTDPDNYVKFSFADGTAFWYHSGAHACTDTAAAANDCYGFIDVNGATNPNTLVYCADAADGSCETSEITDIYPVIFHGQTVEPATDSARAVLFGK